jgi:hypothetical protein
MKIYSITILFYFTILTVILNFSLNEAYSIVYNQMDDNVIPLFIPPYKMIKETLNYTTSQTINITYNNQNFFLNPIVK